MQVTCEQPNAATSKFTGKVLIEGHEPAVLSINNVLLRGSALRNSEYVIGMVINTGVDAKVMQGARQPPTKRSSIDHFINRLMIGIISFLFLLCTVSELNKQLLHRHLGDHWYLHEYVGTSSPLKHPVIGILRFVVLFASLVSVSLYVSVDFTKAAYKKIMQRDPRMYHKESDTWLKVRAMSLIDDLGCISHVFSDKTGTLTQNVMQFRKCSIDGVTYGRGMTETGLARLARLGELPPTSSSAADEADDSLHGEGIRIPPPEENRGPVNFEGPELFQALRDEAYDPQHRDRCREFCLHLALCHSVVVESVKAQKSALRIGNKKGDRARASPRASPVPYRRGGQTRAEAKAELDKREEQRTGGAAKTKLSASSPDEVALVSAATFLGVEFVGRQHSTVTLKDSFSGSQPQFEVLELLDFTSARKRMSVVVREQGSRRIRLLSKGADSVMLPLIGPGQEEVLRETEQHLEDHANEGLRTLVLAQRDLDAATYDEWSRHYRAALSDLAELDKKERELPNEIERLMGEIEVGMELVGSTAIEDKLQQGVPTAIADMGRAGIAVWVLTGDKEETAINIAFACELFDTATRLLVLNLKSHPTAREIHNELLRAAEVNALSDEKHALVVDGEVVAIVMGSRELQLALLQLTLHCHCVVACRCAPSQKAQLVELVKRNVKGAITLAIGDGANDVPMIQAAHVGVGISGQEGMQAANSADFSIAQFRFLQDLLLVHGRNMHRRVATLVLYIFYKNIVMTLVQYWYLFFSAASGNRLYVEVGVQLYNVLYTFLPIVVYSLVDRDVSDETSRKLPQLYHMGIKRFYISGRAVAGWFVESVVESVIIFYVVALSMQKLLPELSSKLDMSQPTGQSPASIMVGDSAYAVVLVVVSIKLIMKSYQLTFVQVGSIPFCILPDLT